MAVSLEGWERKLRDYRAINGQNIKVLSEIKDRNMTSIHCVVHALPGSDTQLNDR